MTSGTREHPSARSAAVAMSPAEFQRLGHALVDSIAGFLGSLPHRPVTTAESPDVIRSLIGADRPLPAKGTDAAEILREATDLLFQHSLFNGHPSFFGYITSSPAPIGILGDLLAAAINANGGAWRLAPIASEIEGQTLRWIAEMIGYPRDCGGIFVSGGNMANIVAALAARRSAADWDIRKQGVAAGAPLRVYASAETHTWIQKATDLAGLGTDAIRWIPTDASLRMNIAALREAVDRDVGAGARPMMVVGTAGSVSTGAVDPLFEIADICREARIWFHVDGAYGALAAGLPRTPRDLEGLSLADSVAVDPHKWLYAPLEAGCVLVRDPEALRNAFSYHPPYYHFGHQATNYVDLGPQNSRGFRALKVWLALRHAGREGYRKSIVDDIALSARLFERVQAHPELEACTHGLSIVTFRYVPPGIDTVAGKSYLNQLNEILLERIQVSGEAFVSNAVVDGRYLLRACIVNFHTREEDVDALADLTVRLGREVRAELKARDAQASS
jgi:glutamate/tyrosine decarboxylase-like PLP-dependent enzyme